MLDNDDKDTHHPCHSFNFTQRQLAMATSLYGAWAAVVVSCDTSIPSVELMSWTSLTSSLT